MQTQSCWVILAAGEGRRLVVSFPEQAGTPKPFLVMGSKPMIWYLLDEIGSEDLIILVVSPSLRVDRYEFPPNVRLVQQPIPRGTGDAVRSALPSIPDYIETIYILNGDGPAVPIDTIRQIGPSSVVVTFRSLLPFAQSMGRYSMETRRIEESPSDPKSHDLINTGVYVLRNDATLHSALSDLPFHEEKGTCGEYFLTDILETSEIEPVIIEDPILACRFQGVNNIVEWEYVDTLLR